jgi:hypothetical protein
MKDKNPYSDISIELDGEVRTGRYRVKCRFPGAPCAELEVWYQGRCATQLAEYGYEAGEAEAIAEHMLANMARGE